MGIHVSFSVCVTVYTYIWQLSEPSSILNVILSIFEAHIWCSGQFTIDLIFMGPILSDNWLGIGIFGTALEEQKHAEVHKNAFGSMGNTGKR